MGNCSLPERPYLFLFGIIIDPVGTVGLKFHSTALGIVRAASFFPYRVCFNPPGLKRKEFEMAEGHKHGTDPKTQRVARWLAENRTEFEGQGIDEGKLVSALGMSATEIREAIAHREAREEVVRLPQALTS